MSRHSNETETTKLAESSTTPQRDSPSPPAIHSLPSELLLEIFIAGSRAPSETGITVPFPILVSMVCQFWRTVAITSPSVWSTVFLPSTTKFDVLAFIERSKPVPFDVILDTMVAWDVGGQNSYDRISRTILDHIQRLRSLKINVWSVDDVNSFVAAFRDAEAPSLKSLEIFLYSQEEPHGSHRRPPIMNRTVALRSLKVKGICAYCSPPMINLTFLDIDQFRPNELEFRALFSACPSLSCLILHRFAARDDAVEPNQDAPQIYAPSLRSLAVSFAYGHSIPCACPLHLVVLENIEYIEISLFSFDLSGHFSSSLRSWSKDSRIRKLRISDVPIEAEELLFIQSLPNTIDLELISIYTNPDLYLPSTISLPNLHSIILELIAKEGVTGQADLSWFSQVVDQRLVKLTSPLTVYLSNLDQGDARIQKIIEILGGHLTVQYSTRKNGLIEPNAFGFLDETDSDEDDAWDYDYDDRSDFEESYELEFENENGFDDEEDEDEDGW